MQGLRKINILKDGTTSIRFIFSLGSSILTLFFCVLVFKPIPSALKLDQDIYNYSVQQDKNFLPFLQKGEDVYALPLSNSTLSDLLSINNSNVTSNVSDSNAIDNINNSNATNNISNSNITSKVNSSEYGMAGIKHNGIKNTTVNNNKTNTSVSSLGKTTTQLPSYPHPNTSVSGSISTGTNTSYLTPTVATITITSVMTTTLILSSSTQSSMHTSMKVHTSYISDSDISTITRESHVPSTNDRNNNTGYKFDMFKLKYVLMITIPIIVSIFILAIALWYWRKKLNQLSDDSSHKKVEDYKIMPIINNETGGIQRTNYFERNQTYGSGIDDSNKWGYRGWGPTSNSFNNKAAFISRNHSMSSANMPHMYQKHYNYPFKSAEEKDISSLGTFRQKPLNRLSGMTTTFSDFQNMRPVNPKNPTNTPNINNNLSQDTLSYPQNIQDTSISSKNTPQPDYGPLSAQESLIEKQYSYSDVPKTLNSQRKISEDRLDNSQKQSPMAQKYQKRPQLYNFSKSS